ncbi:MAG: hypothetical protein ACTHJ0_11520 [Flavipsychrobacter sp.]
MRYLAKGRNSRGFKVYDERDEMIGELVYISSFSRKAQIATNDNAFYDVIPTGFWMNKAEISQDGIVIVSIKHIPGNGTNIWFENGLSLNLRLRSIWRYEYTVKDNDGNEVGNVFVNYVWRTLSYNYEMDLQVNTRDAKTTTLLPIILAYCTHYIRSKGGYVP